MPITCSTILVNKLQAMSKQFYIQFSHILQLRGWVKRCRSWIVSGRSTPPPRTRWRCTWRRVASPTWRTRRRRLRTCRRASLAASTAVCCWTLGVAPAISSPPSTTRHGARRNRLVTHLCTHGDRWVRSSNRTVTYAQIVETMNCLAMS